MKFGRAIALITIFLFEWTPVSPQATDKAIYLRANQIGYLPEDDKIAIAFAPRLLDNMRFEIIDAASGKRVWGPEKVGKNAGAYGNFANHKKDGRTMYGPMPDSTYIDVSGGWHDAGDYLRYLLTSGNAVCRLLFSYRENKGKFKDEHDALGHSRPNGIPDILDEAKWGLDWMLKMHPAPDQLFHQVGDDRDHTGWDLPHEDTSDYGWGPGSYRVAYYATGKPQGLGKYRNTSTGIANLAGRYAAAMAMAADVWKNDLQDTAFAMQCLKAGKEVYEMGKKQPGSCEGVPCLQPYRYYEKTWADDMEWGAAEMFKVTGASFYLDDAKKFARLINTTSWMGADTANHYEYYPYVNLGHYALYPLVDEAFQDTLAGYYRHGIEAVLKRANRNPYRMGVPFIWCSFNLVTDFIAHGLAYEKMTGDRQYHPFMLENRDWLLGRNPWGISAFVGIPPEGGNTPQYPHSVIADKTGRQITGGLNDGPVYASIFKSLKGIRLSREDPHAAFQSDLVVYHDDRWDYSTNEPIMDGTANASFFMAHFAR